MIKFETIRMPRAAKNNHILVSTTDTPNYSFLEVDNELYLVANRINGDRANMEDQVIPAGERLRGFRVKDFEGQKFVVDLKHVDGSVPSVGDILTVSDGKLTTGDAEGVYFKVTNVGVALTGPAIKVKVCVKRAASAGLASWSTGTDEEITAIINGYYDGSITLADIQSVWSVGDVRTVTLAAMEATGVGESHRSQEVELQILDFEHDDLTTAINGKTKALITVDLKNCLRDADVADDDGGNNTEKGYMKPTDENEGGWTSCTRRTWCNSIFYNALPSYMKELVKTVNKLTSAGNDSDTINTDSDKCFLLSEIEIFGSIEYSFEGEGNQYSWYITENNRLKLPRDYPDEGWSANWWERSPRTGNRYFCRVNSDNSSGYRQADTSNGLAPAFCL